MFESIIAITLLVTSVDAIKFRGPRATVAVDVDNLRQHRSIRPTPAPQVELGKRATGNSSPITYYEAPDATCGYINGNAGNFYTCGSGYTCDLLAGSGSSYGAINCCDSNTCGYRTACVNSAQISASCSTACQKNDQIVKCSNTNNPFCVTVRWPGVLAQDFYCDTSPIGILMATTTYSGQIGRNYATYTINTSSSSSSTSSSKVATATPVSSSGSTTGSTSSTAGGLISPQTSSGNTASSASLADASATAGTSYTSASSSSTPIGAIVGGVVGGVVALAAILAALWFFWWRKRGAKAARVNPVPIYNDASNTPAYNAASVQKTPMTESHVNHGAGTATAIAPGFETAAAIPQNDPNKGYYAPQYLSTQPVYEADNNQLNHGPPMHPPATSELPGDMRMQNNSGMSPPPNHNRMSEAGTIGSSGVPNSPTPSHGIPGLHDSMMANPGAQQQPPSNFRDMSATSGPVSHELE